MSAGADRDLIGWHVGMAMAAAVTPMAWIDVAAVGAIQLALVRRLARRHGVAWDALRGRAVVFAVAGASVARIGASAVKSIPGVGSMLGSATQAALSGASTWALGAVFQEHFEHSGTLDNVDAGVMRARYREQLARGRAVARAMRRTMRDEPGLDEHAARLARLEGLLRSGAITRDEFERLVPIGEEPVS